MHLAILFSLSKINFFICKYVICCIILTSNKINCLYDLRESKVLSSLSFSPDRTTVISPTSEQQGTTVIHIGHLDERRSVSAVLLDYYNDRISGCKITSDTNVNNYSKVIIDEFTMAKNDVSFSKAEARRAYMTESIR